MSYDPSQLSSSDLQKVRFLLGGKNSDVLVADEEITYALSVATNIYFAAATCADMIAASKTNKAFTRSVGPLTVDGKTARDSWYDLARQLRDQGKRSVPFSHMLIGVSNQEEKEQKEQDAYPQFSFQVGMHDNTEALPEGGDSA